MQPGRLLGRTFTIECADVSHFFRFEESIYSGAAGIGGEGIVMEVRKCGRIMRQHRQVMGWKKGGHKSMWSASCMDGKKSVKGNEERKRVATTKFTVVEPGHDVE